MDKPLTDEQLTDLATQALVAMALDDYRRELRAEVQVMRDEAATALEHAEGDIEYTAAAVGMAVLDDVLGLLDGSE